MALALPPLPPTRPWLGGTQMATQGMTQGGTLAQFRNQALDAVPIGRMTQPEAVARVAAFLHAPESSAITGQTYNICGGQTMD